MGLIEWCKYKYDESTDKIMRNWFDRGLVIDGHSATYTFPKHKNKTFLLDAAMVSLTLLTTGVGGYYGWEKFQNFKENIIAVQTSQHQKVKNKTSNVPMKNYSIEEVVIEHLFPKEWNFRDSKGELNDKAYKLHLARNKFRKDWLAQLTGVEVLPMSYGDDYYKFRVHENQLDKLENLVKDVSKIEIYTPVGFEYIGTDIDQKFPNWRDTERPKKESYDFDLPIKDIQFLKENLKIDPYAKIEKSYKRGYMTIEYDVTALELRDLSIEKFRKRDAEGNPYPSYSHIEVNDKVLMDNLIMNFTYLIDEEEPSLKRFTEKILSGYEELTNHKKAQKILDFVTKQIQTLPYDTANPNPAYLTLLSGEGTVEEKAILYTSLLEQNNIPYEIIYYGDRSEVLSAEIKKRIEKKFSENYDTIMDSLEKSIPKEQIHLLRESPFEAFKKYSSLYSMYEDSIVESLPSEKKEQKKRFDNGANALIRHALVAVGVDLDVDFEFNKYSHWYRKTTKNKDTILKHYQNDESAVNKLYKLVDIENNGLELRYYIADPSAKSFVIGEDRPKRNSQMYFRKADFTYRVDNENYEVLDRKGNRFELTTKDDIKEAMKYEEIVQRVKR